MATRVGGPGGSSVPSTPAKSDEVDSPEKVVQESVQDTTRPPDQDEWDPEDAKQEYAWQNMDTLPALRKGDESNVAGRSKSVSVGLDKERSPDGKKTVTVRTRGNEESETETTTRSRTNKKGNTTSKSSTRSTDTEREGVARSGEVVLAGEDVVHQRVVGDAMHIVHGKGPGGTTTDAYHQGPSISLSGYGAATAQLMHKDAKGSHFAPGVDLKVSVRVDANLLAGGASITKDIPVEYRGQKFDVIVRLGANGNVGANGDLYLDVHLGADGASVSADANGFAGAKGSLIGSAEVDMNGKELLGGEMQVSFAAGAGAGASFSADLHHFHASAYATVGVGVGVQLDGEVYASNIAQAIPHIISGR